MGGLANVFDWDFFWGTFGFVLKIVAPFVMLIVAIIAVGILLKNIIAAVRQKN
ncbi:PTS ascorbate transporter subunit IIC [Bacillus sp. Bva_UNVM-123]|uniref:PTS ascorbate transporter subunit IIC n=1 Tax=Bacillus sp. Bva_UNVM-123 TaxID=2829798 RepID=UPI00391F9380